MAFILILIKIKLGMQRQRKLFNILHGKYTFSQLDDQTKKTIITVATRGLKDGGILDAENRLLHFTDMQKYGTYALAMEELKIPPVLSTKTGWMYVENPIAVSEKEIHELDVALDLFKKDFNVELIIDK